MWRVYYFDKSWQRYLPLPELLFYRSNAAAKVSASSYRKSYPDTSFIVLPL